MGTQRRKEKEIEQIVSSGIRKAKRIEEIEQHIASLDEIRGKIIEMKNGVVHDYDNMPEELQESATGERMEKVIDLLSEARDGIDEAIENLHDAHQLLNRGIL